MSGLRLYSRPPSAKQQEVIDYVLAVPNVTRRVVCQKFGISPAYLAETYKNYLPERSKLPSGRKRGKDDYIMKPKPPKGPYTLKPCLGPDCNLQHKSTGPGDRLCPKCKESRAQTYAPEYQIGGGK